MSQVNQELVQELYDEGIRSDTHHMTLKSAFKEATGSEKNPTKDQQEEIRTGLEILDNAQAQEAVAAAEGDAEAYVKQQKKENPEDWGKVREPREWNEKGVATRVLIECQNPQVNSKGDSICDETREIAVQDLFQVTRCVPCQNRYTQLYRNERARIRRAEKAKKAS